MRMWTLGSSWDGCINYGLENTHAGASAMRCGLVEGNCNEGIRLGLEIGYAEGISILISLTVESHTLSSHSYLI